MLSLRPGAWKDLSRDWKLLNAQLCSFKINVKKHKTGSPFSDKEEKGLPRISIGGGC